MNLPATAEQVYHPRKPKCADALLAELERTAKGAE